MSKLTLQHLSNCYSNKNCFIKVYTVRYNEYSSERTSTSNSVDPYPGHSLIMVMYLSIAWCWSRPLRRDHFSTMLVLVADISSFIHISSICSSSMRCFFIEPVFNPRRSVPSRKLVLRRSRVCPDPEAPPTLVNCRMRLRRRPTG